MPSLYDGCHLLKSDSIRLVRFRAVSSTVFCNLFVADLSSSPDYIALSYTWGNPFPPSDPDFAHFERPDRIIRVNGFEVTVTANLFDALIALWRVDADAAFWIDALCIDQTNNGERQAQVAIMGDIYSSAREAIVWPGPTRDLEPVRKILFGTFLPRLREANQGDYPGVLNPSTPRPNDTGLDPDVDAFKRWLRFMSRTWFSRVWTFQEAVLPARVRIPFGEDFISMTDACALMALLRMDGYRVGETFTPLAIASMPGTSPALQLALHFALTSELRTGRSSIVPHINTLSTLIAMMVGRRCADPRDKVFAALGLLDRLPVTRFVEHLPSHHHELNCLPPSTNFADDFPIDYHQPIHETYRNFATWIINGTPLLRVLPGSELLSHDLSQIPSWAPDFLSVDINSVTAPLARKFRRVIADSDDTAALLAARRLCGRQLFLSGHQIDTVAAVSAKPLSGLADRDPIDWLSILHLCLELPPQYPGRDESRVEALWRTLVCDEDMTDYNSSSAERLVGQRVEIETIWWLISNHLRDCLAIWAIGSMAKNDRSREFCMQLIRLQVRTLREHLPYRTKLLPCELDIAGRTLHLLGWTMTGNSFDSWPPDDVIQVETGQRLFHAHMGNQRCLVRTRSGLLGLAPQTAQVGDEIWHFQAGDVPYTVRPLEGKRKTFAFIGETYVHGKMREVHEEVGRTLNRQKSEADWEWITIE